MLTRHNWWGGTLMGKAGNKQWGANTTAQQKQATNNYEDRKDKACTKWKPNPEMWEAIAAKVVKRDDTHTIRHDATINPMEEYASIFGCKEKADAIGANLKVFGKS